MRAIKEVLPKKKRQEIVKRTKFFSIVADHEGKQTLMKSVMQPQQDGVQPEVYDSFYVSSGGDDEREGKDGIETIEDPFEMPKLDLQA